MMCSPIERAALQQLTLSPSQGPPRSLSRIATISIRPKEAGAAFAFGISDHKRRSICACASLGAPRRPIQEEEGEDSNSAGLGLEGEPSIMSLLFVESKLHLESSFHPEASGSSGLQVKWIVSRFWNVASGQNLGVNNGRKWKAAPAAGRSEPFPGS